LLHAAGFVRQVRLPLSDPQISDPAPRFEVRVTAESHFAWLRTRLAVERTMMAYIRTAVSLIGFGFAIVQFFHNFHQMPGEATARFPEAAWYLGLALIFCGIMAAVVSIREYRWMIRYLWGDDFAPVAGVTKEAKQTPLYATAIVLVFIGIFAFFAVLLNLV
jgi:putative membrane protein